jgi:hypothetical protein
MKKWSIWLKWFGASISGPDFGTLSTPMARTRQSSSVGSETRIRTKV